MKRIADLDYIAEVQRIDDADELPIVQAADLIGYCMFRRKMVEAGHIAPDKPLARIVGARNGQSMTSANIAHIVRRRYSNPQGTSLTLHYALARSHVATYDPAFTERNLISVEEFQHRFKIAFDADDTGVHVLTEQALEDPRMPKPPD
ncbi:MAG: hypothetical protein U5K81_15335 [Trueperaceae bacterium]|nr:hypothetical protein [Trueperaceae bacterium]